MTSSVIITFQLIARTMRSLQLPVEFDSKFGVLRDSFLL